MKKCPFCGGEGELMYDMGDSIYVVCKSCGCTLKGASVSIDGLEEAKKKTIKKWDTRYENTRSN